MKKNIYCAILYLCLFALFYPEKYFILPVSTIWIAVFLSILFSIRYFLHHRLWREVKFLWLSGSSIFFIGLLVSKVLNQGGDLVLASRGLQIILYSLFGVWVSYLMVKVFKEASVFRLLEILVNLAMFQAIISFIFLLVPSVSDLYRSFVVFDELTLSNVERLSQYRLIGVGDTRFATAAVNYGFMIWAVLLLRHYQYGRIGRFSLYSITIITLFALAGILSGRTFFILLLITIPYVFFLKGCKFRHTTKELFITLIPVIIFGLTVFVYLFASNDQLVSWAFELFINMGDSGHIESESTNQLKDMYIFPSTLATWFIGDGKTNNEYGGFYMGSDVGYIRSIFYWGIIGTIIYLYIQYKMVRKAIYSTQYKAYRVFLAFIFIFLLVYWLKDLYSIEKIICLLIMVQAMSNRISKQRKKSNYEVHNNNSGL